jgi:hypothetical protein
MSDRFDHITHQNEQNTRDARYTAVRFLTTEMVKARVRNTESATRSVSSVPACPGCHDTAFVKHEEVITGTTAIAFWTCASCLRSWPAAKPRMLKADLKNS